MHISRTGEHVSFYLFVRGKVNGCLRAFVSELFYEIFYEKKEKKKKKNK